MEAEPKAAAEALDTILDQADAESDCMETVESFEALELTEDLLRGIYSYGIERPSALQQKGILPLITGRDLICQALSGTGKNITLAIGVLQRVDIKNRNCQALILAPSREHAYDFNQVVIRLGDFMQAQCLACIGGSNVQDEIRKLQEGVHIVAGSPGRIYDMIDRRALLVTDIKMFVLHEAVETCSRGFKDRIYDVFKFMPQKVQVCLFCTTMPGEVHELTQHFMRDPVRIIEKKDERRPLTDVKQFYVVVESEEGKIDTLCSLRGIIGAHGGVIIYVNTRLTVDWLFEKMTSADFSVSRVHEDMEQKLRDDTMKEFRSGSHLILIATESFARGIQVAQVSLTIIYNLPSNEGNYIASLSRPGRFGRTGVAINLVTVEDLPTLKELEKYSHTSIEEMPANVADLI